MVCIETSGSLQWKEAVVREQHTRHACVLIRALRTQAGSTTRENQHAQAAFLWSVASAGERRKTAEGKAGSGKPRAVTTSVEQQHRDADSVQRTEGGLGSSELVAAVLPQKEQENCGKISANGRRALLLLRPAVQLQEPVEPVNGRCKPRSEPGWCIDQSKEQRSGGRANGSKQKGCWWD
ncbi:hypothetical protein B0H14DRAFT_3637416 [Mycena olivaceomarginata]|nr:hypothetical protein B0H14DRAFT_3637416 [Mycena olivaceomarginata]